MHTSVLYRSTSIRFIKHIFLKSNDKKHIFSHISISKKLLWWEKEAIKPFHHFTIPLHALRGDKTTPPFYHRDHWASPAEYWPPPERENICLHQHVMLQINNIMIFSPCSSQLQCRKNSEPLANAERSMSAYGLLSEQKLKAMWTVNAIRWKKNVKGANATLGG